MNLRHTYATRLFELNVPVKTVQVLLGHSDINLTLNTYTHVLEKKNKNSVFN
ncbi:MAG: tyrosine-type recombinase/integrase [Eubacteriaceae bacterium]